MTEFSIGDSVYHKSNASFMMIVIKINEDGTIKCRWIQTNSDKNKTKEIKEYDFIKEELSKVIQNTQGGFYVG